jgi:hypothetical protein
MRFVDNDHEVVDMLMQRWIANKFRRDIKDWAEANGSSLIAFSAGDRKADVMALPGRRRRGRPHAGGRCRLRQGDPAGMTARKRDTESGGHPQFSFIEEQRRV